LIPITDAGHRARCGYRCDDEAATRESENARLRYAWSSGQLVGSLVAAFVAEQKGADHTGKLLRFVPCDNATNHRLRARNPWPSISPALVSSTNEIGQSRK
jgi:hypothetical protein